MSKSKLGKADISWSKKFRKRFSVVILIALIVGYIVLFSYNAFVVASVTGIRFKAEDFDQDQPDNSTVGISGDVVIRNDHWYSVDITDVLIKMTLNDDEGRKLTDKKVEKDKVPRLKNTELDLEFTFTMEDFVEDPEIFLSLNSSEYVEIEFEISFTYGFLYDIYFEIEIEADFDD